MNQNIIIENMTNLIIEREFDHFRESNDYESNIESFSINRYKDNNSFVNFKNKSKCIYNKLYSHLNESDKLLLEEFEELSFISELRELSSTFKYAFNLALEEFSFMDKSDIELDIIKAISKVTNPNSLTLALAFINKCSSN